MTCLRISPRRRACYESYAHVRTGKLPSAPDRQQAERTCATEQSLHGCQGESAPYDTLDSIDISSAHKPLAKEPFKAAEYLGLTRSNTKTMPRGVDRRASSGVGGLFSTRYMPKKNAAKAFDPQKDIPDLSGKATPGLALPRSTSSLPIIIPPYIPTPSRSSSPTEDLVSSIKHSYRDANVEVVPLDLSSFDSIKKCAAHINQKSHRLDILFLNAGIAGALPNLTREGYEIHFGVNYVGHALLTQLLMPKVLQTANGKQGKDVRIVITTSKAAHFRHPSAGLVLDQMKTGHPSISSGQRYAHSKLAAIHFARKLAQNYPSVTSVSIHPGIVKTGIHKTLDGHSMFVKYCLSAPLFWLFGISAEKGARNGLWAAISEDARNGAYYEPVGKLRDRYKYSTDQKLTDELWEWTNKELAGHGAPGWPAP
ncbi:hypothetical protein FQN50_008234 [Emmonsiellopsis sp. PD_5]|nr:hypothetical protein FQN50_008234 [Emmonsiellopsis sp. PD_5]